MIDSRLIRTTAVVLCCLAAVSSGTTSTWDDDDCSSSCDWKLAASWDANGGSCDPCYPSTSDDDATIDMLETVVTIDLEDGDFTIDDLTISSDEAAVLEFDNFGLEEAEITVDTLVITGPTTGAADAVLKVIFGSGTSLHAITPA